MTTKLLLTPEVMPRVQKGSQIDRVQWTDPAPDVDAGRRLSDALALIRVDTTADTMVPGSWQDDLRYEIFDIIQNLLMAFRFNHHMVKSVLGVESKMFRSWVNSPEFKEHLRGLGVGSVLLIAEQLAERKLAEILSWDTVSIQVLRIQQRAAEFVIRERRLQTNADSVNAMRAKKMGKIKGRLPAGGDADYGLEGPPPAVDLSVANPNPPDSWVDDDEPPTGESDL